MFTEKLREVKVYEREIIIIIYFYLLPFVQNCFEYKLIIQTITSCHLRKQIAKKENKYF